jgi:uncharacterized protein
MGACLRVSLLILMIFSCIRVTATESKQIAWDKLQGLGEVEYFSLQNDKEDGSKQLYHIFIRVPEPDQGNAKSYPTLYLLDGGTNFPLLASYYSYLRFMQDVPELIIVGISYGSDDFEKGNARSTDFTAPSAEKSFWGGAEAFDLFLSHQLIPVIQKRYPVDASRQILFGQSLGGQFALYTSMYGHAPFYGVIASNPALHRNLEFFKHDLLKRENRPLAYISSAEFDDPTFRRPALQWQSYWHDKAPEWRRHFSTLQGHNHLSANPEVFRDGLKWLFNTP